jgi:tRNA A-37 threonylcarbamoyl transferase component Bud32
MRLDLSNRHLTEIPEYVFKNKDIEILDLSFNNLTNIPLNILKLQNLKILFLTSNKFRTIPKHLYLLKNLFMLSMKSNELEDINDCKLPISLKWLMLTDNKIKIIPDCFGNLVNLKKLSLSGNEIEYIPSMMINCKELELVRFSNNNIKRIPNWFFYLPKLSYFAYGSNPVIPDEDIDIELLDNIKITNSIGYGASGEVFEGYYNDNKVAIKKFHGKATGDGLAICEMNILSMLGQHDNLVSVLGKTTNGVIMELIDGYKTLGIVPNFHTITRDIIEKKLTLSQIKMIMIGICKAMVHLSEKQIIHGDLYAHNILYNDNNVKLTDFGASFYVKNRELYKPMELCEVRSFGYLLEDMIGVCDEKDDEIIDLINKCLNEDVKQRPTFNNILNKIDKFI